MWSRAWCDAWRPFYHVPLRQLPGRCNCSRMINYPHPCNPRWFSEFTVVECAKSLDQKCINYEVCPGTFPLPYSCVSLNPSFNEITSTASTSRSLRAAFSSSVTPRFSPLNDTDILDMVVALLSLCLCCFFRKWPGTIGLKSTRQCRSSQVLDKEAWGENSAGRYSAWRMRCPTFRLNSSDHQMG